jgi:hypothetical protein
LVLRYPTTHLCCPQQYLVPTPCSPYAIACYGCCSRTWLLLGLMWALLFWRFRLFGLPVRFQQHIPSTHSSPSLIINYSVSIVDSTSICAIINAFVNQCKFHPFIPICCTDYVGTGNYSTPSCHSQFPTVTQLQVIGSISYPMICLLSVLLFCPPLLRNNVSLWSFNLVTQFQGAADSPWIFRISF